MSFLNLFSTSIGVINSSFFQPHFPAWMAIRDYRCLEVESRPENHILMARCGYLGVLPQSFATEWMLKKKILAIVDENAHAIDARMAEGEITLVKLMPPFNSISVVEGTLEFYAHYENSD